MRTGRQEVRDFNRRIIGFIDTQDDGVKVARDAFYRELGRYYPRLDITRDFYQTIIGNGDQTIGLIHQANNALKK